VVRSDWDHSRSAVSSIRRSEIGSSWMSYEDFNEHDLNLDSGSHDMRCKLSITLMLSSGNVSSELERTTTDVCCHHISSGLGASR
jgi:hypothetical protein